MPRGAKRWLLVALVWVLSPIDLVPDFIPIIGPLDDIVVVVLVLRHLLKSTPSEVIAEHWGGEIRWCWKRPCDSLVDSMVLKAGGP